MDTDPLTSRAENAFGKLEEGAGTRPRRSGHGGGQARSVS